MTINTIAKFALAALVLIGVWHGCTRPTLIGSDLLDQEVAGLVFTDSFDVVMATVTEDSVLIHSAQGGPQVVKHVVGQLDDPFFGTSSSEIYTEMFLNGVGTAIVENTNVIDSVVLHLVYDSAGIYGDLTQAVTVEARQIFTPLDNTQDYYSNATVSANLTPMGVKESFVPKPYDSLTLIRDTDTSLVPPMLRIPINQDFINNMLLQTPGTFEFSDSFAMWFDGIRLRMTEGSNTMLSFDLGHPQSGMTVYMSNTGAENLSQYRFIFLGVFFEQVQLVHFEHDFGGSAVEPFLDDTQLADSLIFIQSMSGVNAEMTFTGLENLNDVLINQAELEFYMADIPGNDTMLYPPIERMTVRRFNNQERLVNTVDVSLALQIQEIRVFGGTSMATDTAGLNPRKYVMNITSSVQDIVQEREPNQLFLSSFAKANQANRVILYGPGHSEYPARLRLTYTKVQ